MVPVSWFRNHGYWIMDHMTHGPWIRLMAMALPGMAKWRKTGNPGDLKKLGVFRMLGISSIWDTWAD